VLYRKGITLLSHLSDIIFLTPFSTVSSLYSLSFLKFHSLISLHDGRTQEICYTTKGLLYCDHIYCSLSAVSYHLSHSFPNCLISVLSLLCQNFTLSSLYMMEEPKKCVILRRDYSTMVYSTLVSHLYPIIFLTPFSTVSSLYCLSFLKFHSLISLHDG
jgi:hypothetical protein